MKSLTRRSRQCWCSRSGLHTRWLSHLVLLLVAAACIQGNDYSQDDRCYLSNGGSSETFTVREDLPVESIIGTLPIPGDPSEFGDIELTLAQDNSPVGIQPGTKNLILKQPLDKEGVSGAASVMVDIVCNKKETDDPNANDAATKKMAVVAANLPNEGVVRTKDHYYENQREIHINISIKIPVRIIVTDANDNAPVFVGAPYSVNVSEVTVVGSTVIQSIKAIDKDQYGPFSTVEYHVDPGPYSHLLAFENRLEGYLVLMGSLDYETLPSFTINIRAQDSDDPPQSTVTTLTVYVQDADDQNPRFLAERYTTMLPDVPRPGMMLEISPAPIKAEDPDLGIRAPIQYSFNSDSKEYSYFELNRRTSQVTIRKPLPDDLRLPITLVIKATQMDNPDRYSLTTLTIESDKMLPSDLKFLQSDYVTTVLESAPVGQVVLSVHTTKPNDKHVRLQLLKNPSEEFAIQNTGEIIVAKPLDYEKQQHYSLKVVASDGRTSDVARVNVTVMNVNDHDPIFAHTQYNFLVKKDDVRIGSLVGKIEVTDGDVNDTIELNVKGPFARVFSISHKGELRIRSLEFLNASTCHVIVVATDSGMPPRKASVPVTVQFPEDVAQSSVYKVKKTDNSLVLMIVFGVLLGTLIIVIITLTIYILKTKQYRDRLPTVVASGHPVVSKMASYMTGTGPPNKSPNPGPDGAPPQSGVENPVFNMTESQHSHENGIRRSTTPAPTELSAWKSNGSVPDMRNDREDSSPHTNGTFARLGSALGNGKVQNVYWPNGSIPRRVKKLSWEDEQPNRTELDPDVSVTPLSKTTDSSQQPGLTVYF